MLAAMFVLWAGSRRRSPWASRRAATPSSTPRGVDQAVTADQAGGQHGGQGGPLRPAASRPVRRLDHRHLDRRGQLAPTTASPRSAARCPLVNMMLGEVSPGGVGAGLYGMLIFALLAVFIAGLMVGRTPEYLGKKIQAAEMKLVVLYILVVPLAGARLRRGLGAAGHAPRRSILNPGPARPDRDHLRLHLGGQQQRLGLRRPHRQHRLVQHDPRPRMLVGRFFLIVPVLAIAGSLVRKQPVPAVGRHLPHRHPAVRRPARRRRPDRRRPDLLPRPRPRPHRRAARASEERPP